MHLGTRRLRTVILNEISDSAEEFLRAFPAYAVGPLARRADGAAAQTG